MFYLQKSKKQTFFTLLSLSIGVILLFLPLAFIVIKASHNTTEAYSNKVFFGKSLFENLAIAWQETKIGQYFFNSLKFAFVITFFKITFSLMFAAGLEFFELKFKKALIIFVLFSMLFSTDVLFLSLYQIITLPLQNGSILRTIVGYLNPLNLFRVKSYGFGLSNTFLGLVLPFLASAVGSFVFYQNFSQFPREYRDIALVEGVKPSAFFLRILVPLQKNTIISLTYIYLISGWNQYLWPRILLQDNSKQLVQTGINSLLAAADYYHLGIIMAGVLINLMPSVFFFIFLERFFLKKR